MLGLVELVRRFFLPGLLPLLLPPSSNAIDYLKKKRVNPEEAYHSQKMKFKVLRVKFKFKTLIGNYVLTGEGTDGYFLILVEKQKAKKGSNIILFFWSKEVSFSKYALKQSYFTGL